MRETLPNNTDTIDTEAVALFDHTSTSGFQKMPLLLFQDGVEVTRNLKYEDLQTALAMEQISKKRRIFGKLLKSLYLKTIPENLKLDPEIVKIVMEGRLRLSILINTPGGTVKFDDILFSLGDASTLCEDIDIYATTKACSLGADVLLQGQQIYCLRETNIMWHGYSAKNKFKLGKIGTKINDKLLEKAQKESVRSLKTKLKKKTKQSKWPELEKKITAAVDDPDNKLNEVEFTGSELETTGVVDQAFNTVEELMEYFHKRTSIVVNLENANHPITKYFVRAEEESSLRQKLPPQIFKRVDLTNCENIKRWASKLKT